METYTLYIGSNNETKQLELDRIKSIIEAKHNGYTLYNATGAWLGSEEQTAVVIIHDEPEAIKETIRTLRIELNQDAIGYQVAPTMQFDEE